MFFYSKKSVLGKRTLSVVLFMLMTPSFMPTAAASVSADEAEEIEFGAFTVRGTDSEALYDFDDYLYDDNVLHITSSTPNNLIRTGSFFISGCLPGYFALVVRF